MIYLLFCILISVAILILFSSFHSFGIDRNNSIIISYFVAFALSFLTRDKSLPVSELPQHQWFYIGLITGVFFYIGFQIFALSTKKIGLAITSVSGNMSVVVPVVIAMAFYGEDITVSKIGGILLILFSFYFIFKKEKHIEFEMHFIYLPVLLFVVTGINAALLGYSDKTGASEHNLFFMALIFLSSFIFGFFSNLLNKNRKTPDIKALLAGILLGVLNYGSTMMILKSLTVVPDSIFFPVYNSGYIALSAILGFIVFKEKLRAINWAGITIAMIAIIIITSGI
jgi:drug/metabolite transporter (DMT)-like permease